MKERNGETEDYGEEIKEVEEGKAKRVIEVSGFLYFRLPPSPFP
jgi:hypothetical protein